MEEIVSTFGRHTPEAGRVDFGCGVGLESTVVLAREEATKGCVD